jgi:hypothetical protein
MMLARPTGEPEACQTQYGGHDSESRSNRAWRGSAYDSESDRPGPARPGLSLAELDSVRVRCGAAVAAGVG